MSGLLFPAYQKFYSALSNLDRFDKESNFFDNISAIDNFFNEYRNITFAMQKSLKYTAFFSAYEKNRDLYLTDHWFVEKRNETIKQKPFDLVKEISITLYLPFGGFTVYEKKYSVVNDVPLESTLEELKDHLRKVDLYEVCFSVSYSFHEADSNIELLERALQGVASMKRFMEVMEQDIGEQCPLCDQLKNRINDIHLTDVPLDFLLVTDYTYYPEKDCFDKAERINMFLSLTHKKVANHQPLSSLTKAEHFNYDGTAFGNFTLRHAILRTIQPGIEIMPAIMVVYDDDTYDLDAFNATMKTTMYRKLMEAARVVDEQNVVEICYLSLYSTIIIEPETPKTSRDRILQSTSDVLVCASIDNKLHEKEYVFNGKNMESIEYIVRVMQHGPNKQLDVSATNLFPIKCAFERKLNKTAADIHHA